MLKCRSWWCQCLSRTQTTALSLRVPLTPPLLLLLLFADLFWALRGGGTFGVILSVTYRLHAVPATGAVGMSLSLSFLRGVDSSALFFDGLLGEWMGA